MDGSDDRGLSERASWDSAPDLPCRIGSSSTTAVSWGTGERLQLTERFTRVDADTLLYQCTVDNPAVCTRSFAASFPMNRSDLPLYEYACHEGIQYSPWFARRGAGRSRAAEKRHHNGANSQCHLQR